MRSHEAVPGTDRSKVSNCDLGARGNGANRKARAVNRFQNRSKFKKRSISNPKAEQAAVPEDLLRCQTACRGCDKSSRIVGRSTESGVHAAHGGGVRHVRYMYVILACSPYISRLEHLRIAECFRAALLYAAVGNGVQMLCIEITCLAACAVATSSAGDVEGPWCKSLRRNHSAAAVRVVLKPSWRIGMRRADEPAQ